MDAMSDSNAVGHQSVQELVHQRDQLRAWIARLDEVGSQAAGHVAQRVRGDYEARLKEVTEALSTHGEEIERDRAAAGTAVAEAEARRAEAGDRLEEQRLRHLIGELPEDAWDQVRPELEGELSAAEDALVGARAELERLETLAAEVGAAAAPPPEERREPEAPQAAALTGAPDATDTPESRERDARAAEVAEADAWEPQMDEAESAPEPAAEAPPPAADAASADEWDPFGGEFGADAAETTGDAADELPWLDDLEAGTKAWDGTAAAGTADDEDEDGDEGGLEFLKSVREDDTQPEPPATPRADGGGDLGDDDLAFLEELDRAISSSPAPATPPAAQPSAGGATPGAGGKGVKAEPLLCKECGAINEPHAWYCEICGSEL
jgi:hypothetical protein